MRRRFSRSWRRGSRPAFTHFSCATVATAPSGTARRTWTPSCSRSSTARPLFLRLLYPAARKADNPRRRGVVSARATVSSAPFALCAHGGKIVPQLCRFPGPAFGGRHAPANRFPVIAYDRSRRRRACPPLKAPCTAYAAGLVEQPMPARFITRCRAGASFCLGDRRFRPSRPSSALLHRRGSTLTRNCQVLV
jgi:hypothetical protein